MTYMLKASPLTWRTIHHDLSRPHPHAHERIGFAFANAAKLTDSSIGLYLSHYSPVADENYIFEPRVGALINGDALRDAMQFAYRNQLATFHVHRHEHYGKPWFSKYDLQESNKFVPDFFHVVPGGPHGALLLSHDSAAGLIWTAKNAPAQVLEEIVFFTPTLTAMRQ